MKIIVLIIVLCLMSNLLRAQETLQGKVMEHVNGADQLLPGAYIYWTDSSAEALTDNEGRFTIAYKQGKKAKLIAVFIGYLNDTIEVKNNNSPIVIHMHNNIRLKDVEIKSKRDATVISTIQPKNIEIITEKELLKAACCNLSESFETNPTIDVNYTDAVTGAKEIQMLGLSGVYTQLLTEAIPSMRGLGSIFGLSYIPGPWMESIQISKGAGSVTNGHEAITGQINVEYKKPEDMKEKMFINLFGDNDGRVELNTINNIRISDKWKYMLMIHGNYNNTRMDNNNDGFLDMPLEKQMNIYNRFRYHSGGKLEGQAGVKVIAEDRIGGQLTFDPAKDSGRDGIYGVSIKTRRVEAYTKTGLVYPEKPYKSMGLQMLGIFHQQQSYFGAKSYDAEQRSFYANYAYVSMISSTIHKFRVGADLKLDHIKETYQVKDYLRTETIPGIYAEYTFDNGKRWGLIAGSRLDYFQDYGWYYSPRLHIKYNFSPDLIARVSGGSGFRSPNIFADNIGVMANSKTLIILEKPGTEKAWNGGVNFTARFHFLNREATFSGDYYYTWFETQYLTDQFSVSDAVLFYNLHGNSMAQSIQATLTYEPIEKLFIKLAGKQDEVQTDYLFYPKAARPLFPKSKALFNISYETEKAKWRFDATAQWFGPKPLPATSGTMNIGEFPIQHSPDYFIYNAQVTKVFKNLEIYIGGENLAGFNQKDPIMNPQHPFSSTFNASSIWGPISGSKIYGGLRLKIF